VRSSIKASCRARKACAIAEALVPLRRQRSITPFKMTVIGHHGKVSEIETVVVPPTGVTVAPR
jgi:hypothetical protein